MKKYVLSIFLCFCCYFYSFSQKAVDSTKSKNLSVLNSNNPFNKQRNSLLKNHPASAYYFGKSRAYLIATVASYTSFFILSSQLKKLSNPWYPYYYNSIKSPKVVIMAASSLSLFYFTLQFSRFDRKAKEAYKKAVRL